MTALTSGDYVAAAALLAAFVALPGTITIFMLKGMRTDNANFRAQTASRFQEFEERVREMESEKVDKRDWIREQVSMAAKVDIVGREISALNGKYDASLGIGAGISRTAESIRTLAQAVSESLEKKGA
jgi:hypothetical protein